MRVSPLAKKREPGLPNDVDLPKIEIHVGEACNNRCAFCTSGWLNAEAADGALAPVPRPRIGEQLAQGRREGARRVLFQGGEPTVRRDLGDLVADAYAAGYEATSVFTNARMAASESGARRLAEMGVTWFQTSIQGGNAASHDAAVRAPAAFRQTLGGVRRLMQHGQRVKVNSVLTVHLLDSIEEYARVMIELRPEEVGLDTVKPSGAIAPSRASYAALVPSFAPYAADLRDALLAMDRAGLVVRLTSFAPCLAPGTEHLVAEEASTTRTMNSHGRSLDKLLWKRSMQTKAEGCAACAYDDVCGGVYDDYAKAHCLAHLRPYATRAVPAPIRADDASPLAAALGALFSRSTSELFGVRAVRPDGPRGFALDCFGPKGDMIVLVGLRDEAPAFGRTELFSIRYLKERAGAADDRILGAIVRVLARHEAQLRPLIQPGA